MDPTESLPEGCILRPLRMNRDDRGVFTELHRRSWDTGVDPSQWNFVVSKANVLRGVHVHVVHDDYLVIARGRATVGVSDIRPGSPTFGRSAMVELDGESLAALIIPHGVAHGFYFHTDAIHVYSVSHDFDPIDELGCRFDDPGLGLRWPTDDPRISDRDRGLPTLDILRVELDRRRRERSVEGGAR